MHIHTFTVIELIACVAVPLSIGLVLGFGLGRIRKQHRVQTWAERRGR